MNIDRKLVKFTLTFILGIVIGYYTNLSYFTVLAIFICVSILMLALFHKVLPIILVIFALCFGVLWTDINTPNLDYLAKWQNKDVEITGIINPVTLGEGKYIVKLEKINGKDFKGNKLLVQIKNNNLEYFWGDKIKLKGRLYSLRMRTNPGGFSEEKYWSLKGVSGRFITFSKGKLLERNEGFLNFAYKIREKVKKKIKENFGDKESGIILGLILGDKTYMDPGDYENFQKIGVAHVFAVSGLHVGYVLLIYWFLSRILKTARLTNLIMVFFLLSSYSLLTGFTPSVVRASAMAFFVMLGTYFLRYKDFYTMLSSAALIILLFNPLELFSPSFQLSFLTTWGLVYFYPIAQEIFCRIPSIIKNILAVTFAAQVSSLPISIYYFNTISLFAPLMNIIIVSLFSLIVPLLFFTLAITFIANFLAEPFILFISFFLNVIVGTVNGVINYFPWGCSYLKHPHLYMIVVYYFLLIVLREIKWIREKVPRVFRVKLGIISVILLTILILPISKDLNLTFLDVGQGDSCVINSLNQEKIIIDGGPGEDTLFNYLKYLGTNKVALVILSHPDYDHINGLYKVLDSLKVGLLLVPPDVEENKELKRLKDIARNKGTKIVEAYQGINLSLRDGINLKVLSPDRKKIGGLNVNDASLVLTLTYGKEDILFTGDIENEGIKRVLEVFSDIEVMKIPHHGSKGSYLDEFYQKTSPELAIISVGRNNNYGHPHSLVIDNLMKRDTDILRTDKDGAIMLKVKKDKIYCSKMLKSNIEF